MSSDDAKKVYISNLNKSITQEALQKFFGASAVKIDIGRIGKYGWVTFSDEVSALEALKKDGGLIGDAAIGVKAYNPPPPRPPREPRATPAAAAGAGGAAKAPRAPRAPRTAAAPAAPAAKSFAVSVMNLPEDLSQESLVGIFEKYGAADVRGVEKRKLGRNQVTIVTFGNAESVAKALVLDKASVNGQVVSVREFRVTPPKPAAPAPAVIPAAGAGGKKKPVGKAAPVSAPAPAAARVPRSEGAIIPDSVAVLGVRGIAPEVIAEAFAGAGEIDSIRLVFRGSVAIVKFTDAGAVAKALALSNTEIEGRSVRVDQARKKPRAPKRKAAPAAAAGGAGGAPRAPKAAAAPAAPRPPAPRRDNPATVWLGELPTGATADDVSGAVAKFGAIATVYVAKEKPFAFVTFESEASAKAAASAGAVTVNGTSVKVEGSRGRVYVGDLAEGTTEDALAKAMEVFGPLVSAAVHNTSGFVVYQSVSAANAAVAAGTVNVNGNAARIEAARPRRRFNRRGPAAE